MRIKEHIITDINSKESDKDRNKFINELLSIYYSEKKLNETLPTMIFKAKNSKIVDGLTTHLKFTQEHILRLETFFKSINQCY